MAMPGLRRSIRCAIVAATVEVGARVRTITGAQAYGLGFCAIGTYAIGAIDSPAF